ncbi:MAG TPA: TonB family protein [Cyclobacteriaceae bacterium]|nr:TonB family protein [Cyclobacteriaceae bacterium]
MNDLKDDIRKYRSGELSPKEMHELERRALSDPFLADALEGAESIAIEDLEADLAGINHAIQPKRQIIFTPIRIAAGVVLLIGAGLYLFWPDTTEQLAEDTSSQTITTPADSVPKQQEQLTLAEKPKEQESKQESAQESTSTKRIKPVESPLVLAPDTTSAKDIQVAPAIAKTDTPPSSASKRISGSVTVAEDGLPLPGVSIKVKGTSLGTTTDINGKYSLNVPDSTSLIFSFVGMQTSEVSIHDKANLNVKMNEDVSQLSEVVITRSAIPRPANAEPVVILAEPAGGIKAYDKYMEDNLRYPQQALENNVKGRVVVEFNISVDGAITNFVVMRSLGYGCDDEVIRLVKEGPTWTPTTEDNKPVESSVRVRMKFDPTKAKKKR